MKIELHMLDLPERDLRAHVDEDALDELAASFRDHGQLQPIGVKINDNDRFEVVYGARRTRAANLLGWYEIDAVLVDDNGHVSAAAAKLIENVQRQDLTPVEESHGLVDLIGEGEIDLRTLQRQTGKSRDWLKTRLDILVMPDDIQATLQAGKISIAVAREFSKIENGEIRKQYLTAAIENGCTAELARAWANQAKFSESGMLSAEEFKQSQLDNKPEPQVVDQKYPCFICKEIHSWRRISFHSVCGNCQEAIVDSRAGVPGAYVHPPVDTSDTIV